ncbi:uncharacterized protein yc1106_03801 [Curvularia clavata]|uniref:Uncharacterized protein n=1 Tax=Curvularia clavata TaxID=95742 RepID=A0A9Q8Z564_CURCL|nr:uncharacterized protein yc1106_03801 [Curvularia clavata]
MPSSTTKGTILSFLYPISSSSEKISTSHIPRTTSSVLYKAADPTYSKPYLVVSTVDDVAYVDVAQVCKFWGEKEGVEKVDVRVFEGVQVFEKGKDNPAHTLLVALMQPAPGGAAELDAWYREEHNEQMSQQPGWLRTCRYSLVAQRGTDSEAEKEKQFSCLAIHEFEERNALGDTVKALEPVSEWTKKVMSEAEGIDAAIYRKI